MFTALKTMSFAVATPGDEFRKMLYEAHIAHLNAESLAGRIKFISDQLFPDRVFCEFSPPPTPEEELQRLAQETKQSLPKAFPDQLRSVLGPEAKERFILCIVRCGVYVVEQ
jgi:Sorting nexin C terminal